MYFSFYFNYINQFSSRNDNCINAMTKLVIVQFRPIVTICPNWTMANFQTRKSKYHIMSRTIFINVQRVNVLLTHFFLSCINGVSKWYKNCYCKKPNYNCTLSCFDRNPIEFYFNPFWSDQRDCDLNRKKWVSNVFDQNDSRRIWTTDL